MERLVRRWRARLALLGRRELAGLAASMIAIAAVTGLVEFVRLFRPEEGRMGVTVTFAALLELLREGLVDIAQAEPYQPLYVRRAERNPDAPELKDVEITTA